MSAFLPRADGSVDLCVEKVNANDDGLWRLTAPLIYQSDVAKQTFVVPAGFVTDYASVPRAPLVYWLCGDTSTMASVVHDWLYTTHPVTRDVADAVLKEASLLTGVAPWRAELMYLGVRIGGGGKHWNGSKTAA